jgi:hypothetical protein
MTSRRHPQPVYLVHAVVDGAGAGDRRPRHRHVAMQGLELLDRCQLHGHRVASDQTASHHSPFLVPGGAHSSSGRSSWPRNPRCRIRVVGEWSVLDLAGAGLRASSEGEGLERCEPGLRAGHGSGRNGSAGVSRHVPGRAGSRPALCLAGFAVSLSLWRNTVAAIACLAVLAVVLLLTSDPPGGGWRRP